VTQYPLADMPGWAAGWFQEIVDRAHTPPTWEWLLGTRVALAVPLIGWLIWARRQRSAWLPLAPLIAISTISLLRVAATSGADTDEVEHLHVAWLITHDVLPYRDVHQNHAPLHWLIATPLLNVLPDSACVLYAFRGLALVAFGGCVGLACALLRALAGGDAARLYPACVCLALIHAVEAQMYRFRPDIFMVACALGSLLCLVRAPRRPGIYPLLAGALLGLAISFSPKIGLQLGVAGLAVIMYLVRRQSADAVRLGAGYGGGLVLGLLPTVGWLWHHGIVLDAWHSVFAVNAEMLGGRRPAASWATSGDARISTVVVPRVLNLAPYAALVVAGAVGMLKRSAGSSPAMQHHPASRLLTLASLVLFFAFAALAPNYLPYHIAGGLILGAAIGAGVVDRLVAWGRRGLRPVWVGLALAVAMGDTWIRSGVVGRVEGSTARVADIQALLDVTRRRGRTCLCLAPMHPIFALDAGHIYTGFDRYSWRWGDTVDRVLSRPPGVVMDFSWAGLVQRQRITSDQRIELANLLEQRYRPITIGGQRFWLRDQPAAEDRFNRRPSRDQRESPAAPAGQAARRPRDRR